jgi:hypothetical protein
MEALKELETCVQEMAVLLQQVERSEKRPYVVLDKQTDLVAKWKACETFMHNFSITHDEDKGDHVLPFLDAYDQLKHASIKEDKRRFMAKFERCASGIFGEETLLRDFRIELSEQNASTKTGKALMEQLAETCEEHAKILALPLDTNSDKFDDEFTAWHETSEDQLFGCILQCVEDPNFDLYGMKFIFPHIAIDTRTRKRIRL